MGPSNKSPLKLRWKHGQVDPTSHNTQTRTHTHTHTHTDTLTHCYIPVCTQVLGDICHPFGLHKLRGKKGFWVRCYRATVVAFHILMRGL